MRVLLTGSYLLQNVGDVAMMQVAARRLRGLFPSASIALLTEAPQRVTALFPGVEPIVVPRARARRRGGSFLRRGARFLNRAIGQGTGRANPAAFDGADRHVLARSVRDANLFLVCGMGGLNDAFAGWAARLLYLLEVAEQSGVPVGLVGQGLGPLTDPVFTSRVARALRAARLIAVRERLAGPALLARMGVSPDIVRITGDDAIEPAYEARPEQIGSYLGINLRVAEYAGTGDAVVTTMRQVVRDASARLKAPVVPIPISHRHSGLDAATNRALLADVDPASDGGATLVTPLDVIRQVGRCRVVVTGSYHAAVFALSQGIPAVALVNSPYYADKFLGLADMFGCGCEVVPMDTPGFSVALGEAIDRAWESAGALRPRLLAAASAQVEQGYEAYLELRTLLVEHAVVEASAGRHVD